MNPVHVDSAKKRYDQILEMICRSMMLPARPPLGKRVSMRESTMEMSKALEIANDVFKSFGYNAETIEDYIRMYTGYPSYFESDDPEKEIRQQLEGLRNDIIGKELMMSKGHTVRVQVTVDVRDVKFRRYVDVYPISDTEWAASAISIPSCDAVGADMDLVVEKIKVSIQSRINGYLEARMPVPISDENETLVEEIRRAMKDHE